MDIIAIIGLVSAIVSIPAYFIPSTWKSKKAVYILLIIIAALLSGIIVNQNAKLLRTRSVSRAAQELVKRQSVEFTDAGFVQAGLAFMEQNKDIYPDAYIRAKEIHDKVKNSVYTSEWSNASYAISGLLKGIGILSNVSD